MRNKTVAATLRRLLGAARYEVLPAGTIEDKVLAMQQRKRDLFDAVVAGDGRGTGALTAEDVRALLDERPAGVRQDSSAPQVAHHPAFRGRA